jgi:hypothetical protein
VGGRVYANVGTPHGPRAPLALAAYDVPNLRITTACSEAAENNTSHSITPTVISDHGIPWLVFSIDQCDRSATPY